MDKVTGVFKKIGKGAFDTLTGVIGMARRSLGFKGTRKYRQKGTEKVENMGSTSIEVEDSGKKGSGVDGFAPSGTSVKKSYNYNYDGQEIDIGEGYATLGEETKFDQMENEGYYEEGDLEGDFWEEEVKVSREDIKEFSEKIENIEEYRPDFLEVVNYYRELGKHKGDNEEAKFLDMVRYQVGEIVQLSQIGHVPSFVSDMEQIVEGVLENIQIKAAEEKLERAVREELGRHEVVYKEFVSIIEDEDDGFTYSGWKIGVKYIDFVKKESDMSDMMLILTKEPLQEVVKTIREGYLPTYLEGTAFEKVGLILENLVKEELEEGEDFRIHKSYETYKRGLPMYRRLRNRGKLVDINKILNFYYNEIDKAKVKDVPNVDVYLGVIGKEEVILSYLEFIYGKAKQSEAMSDFVMRLMQERPKVVEQLSELGYANGDNPKGVSLYFTGHIVMYVETGKGKHNIAFNKAPSDILAKDVKTIASKFSKDWTPR